MFFKTVKTETEAAPQIRAPKPFASLVGEFVVKMHNNLVTTQARADELEAHINIKIEELRQLHSSLKAMDAAIRAVGNDPALSESERILTERVEVPSLNIDEEAAAALEDALIAPVAPFAPPDSAMEETLNFIKANDLRGAEFDEIWNHLIQWTPLKSIARSEVKSCIKGLEDRGLIVRTERGRYMYSQAFQNRNFGGRTEAEA